ncbi:translation initiation factor 2-alpha kinase [Acrasis kona]|uniref:non-specific serine/threonine protein kinase n=1 Tax=Acrasis kona TaxID=1008807 RepID=A0AAW2ZC68_9EUKA
MQHIFSNNDYTNKKSSRNTYTKRSYQDELSLDGDDFFFPKQDSPKETYINIKNHKEKALERMCSDIESKYGSSVDSFSGSPSSLLTSSSDENENNATADIIGNLLSTSTMSSSSTAESFRADSYMEQAFKKKIATKSAPPLAPIVAKSLPIIEKHFKPMDKNINSSNEKEKKKRWFKANLESDSDEDDYTDEDTCSSQDMSPLHSKNGLSYPLPSRQSSPTISLQKSELSRLIEEEQRGRSFSSPSEPSSATTSTLSASAFETLPPQDEDKLKRSELTVFLLQHVCRQFNPDPEFFQSMCAQLYDKGYLDDEKFLDKEYLKRACKGFMVDVLKNWPLHNQDSKIKRSESMGSFMSHLTSGQQRPSTSSNINFQMPTAAPLHKHNSSMPFYDDMFYNPSRFQADFLSKQIIGKGAFGCVYKSKHRIDGFEYAIKRVKFSFKNVSELESSYRMVIREVHGLASCDHPNVIRYNQAWFEPCRQSDYHPVEGTDGLNISSCDGHCDVMMSESSEHSFANNKTSNELVVSNHFVHHHPFQTTTTSSSSTTTATDHNNASTIPDSPVNMSYLEYAIERRNDEEKWRTEVKTLFDNMFNVRNLKFEMFLFIQMQLCQQRTLEDWLWNDGRVKEGFVDSRSACRYILQIANGMEHVHEKGLIHRDLKPPNIFLSDDGNIKIGDFGLAKFAFQMDNNLMMQYSESMDNHTCGVGTFLYASPEQLSRKDYDCKSDVFSLGIIFFEMLHPVATRSERAHVLSQVRCGVIPDDMMKKFPKQMKLIQWCVKESCEDRPDMKQVVQGILEFEDLKNDLQETIKAQHDMILQLQKELEELKLKM